MSQTPPSETTATAPAATAAADGAGQTVPGTDLVLSPPQPVPAVSQSDAAGMIKVDPDTAARIDATVAAYVDSVAQLDIHSPAFAQKVSSIHAMGEDEIRA